jgi:hypothetical protein
MVSGNGVPAATDRDKGVGVRGDSEQLRDIQDIIAKLDDVNRRLAMPARVMSAREPAAARGVDNVELPSAAAS